MKNAEKSNDVIRGSAEYYWKKSVQCYWKREGMHPPQVTVSSYSFLGTKSACKNHDSSYLSFSKFEIVL